MAHTGPLQTMLFMLKNADKERARHSSPRGSKFLCNFNCLRTSESMMPDVVVSEELPPCYINPCGVLQNVFISEVIGACIYR